jgi:type I restriction enzyme R subunit
LTAYSSLVLRSFTRRPVIVTSVEAGQWDRVIDYVNREAFDKPSEFYTLDKLRKTAALDRTLSLREILEKVFGLIRRFKPRDELLEEFSKFVADHRPTESDAMPAIKNYFKPMFRVTRSGTSSKANTTRI